MTLPSKDQILEWVQDNPARASKREVARAFGVKGADRVPLKRMLRELEEAGHIRRDRKTLRDPNTLPPVAVLRVVSVDAGGDLWAEPAQWEGTDDMPRVLVIPQKGDPALSVSDRLLARTAKSGETYEARLIRRIAAGPRAVLGIFRKSDTGGRILPIDKKSDREWRVESGDVNGAREGELVEGEQAGPKGRMGLPRARITARLGDPSQAKAVSLIAIHEHGIPDAFPPETLEEAETAKPVPLGQRVDLRDLPLLTIDPSDARDHDDAICAEETETGFRLWVAIADVAHYVTPGSALDREARGRGNSTYFPDRVVPMLPDRLSGDLCSLHEGVERPCIVVEIEIGKDGRKTRHSFSRAMMRSAASLSYEQAQAIDDGQSDLSAELKTPVKTLFAAYRCLLQERGTRNPLNLDLPERKIVLTDSGQVASVAFGERFDAHKLVEECMILANVCAAETLEAKRIDLLYRVHEEPSPEKLEGLRETASEIGLVLAKGQVLTTRHLNQLLDQAAGSEDAELINMSVLRSMTQAYYGPQNFGHFGLALRRYAHFTSPIRRYADLLIHRALITAHGWGKDGLSPQDRERLAETAEVINLTERRSMQAERDTTDRYLAAFLADHVGAEFEGRISGVARFGVFVRLDGTGADGLVPISLLGGEYFRHDPNAQTLTGDQSRRVISVGQNVTVRLSEAVPITGGVLLEILTIEGKALPQSSRPGRSSKGRGRKKISRNKRGRKA